MLYFDWSSSRSNLVFEVSKILFLECSINLVLLYTPLTKYGNSRKNTINTIKMPLVKCLKVMMLMKEYSKKACRYQFCVKV